MNEHDLKRAFGTTPPGVEACIRRSLSKEREATAMKRKHTVTLIAAALIAALLCGTALASVTGLSLRDMFTQTSEDGATRVNEAAISHIRAVDCRYESENVRYAVNECLYNSKDEMLALSAIFTSKVPGNRYYILLEGMSIGGSDLEGASEYNFTEFFLGDESVNSRCSAFVRGSSGSDVSIRYAVLKLIGTIVSGEEAQALRAFDLNEDLQGYEARFAELAAEGFVYVEPDGVVACVTGEPGLSYADQLVATGCFELTDRFTVTFEAEDSAEDSGTLSYTGPKVFELDGAKIEILSAEVGEIRATVALRATLTNEAYRAWFGEEGCRDGWSLRAGGEMMHVDARGRSSGFIRNDNDTWTITEEYTFGILYSQPTEIPLIIEAMSEDGTGAANSNITITLTFARK